MLGIPDDHWHRAAVVLVTIVELRLDWHGRFVLCDSEQLHFDRKSDALLKYCYQVDGGGAACQKAAKLQPLLQ